MIVAGIDVGSLTAKAVILKERNILAAEVMKNRSSPEQSAAEIMEKTLLKSGVSAGEIQYCVGTGYGRQQIDFVSEAVSEIACHGKGAFHFHPTVRTIIDVGGQDCKVIRIDGEGNLVNFITNDKCAAGTGRFLEVMAKLMEVELKDIGYLSQRSRNPLVLTSTCNVWAQSEVVYHINDRKPIEDIAAGINFAMAERVSILAKRVKGTEKDYCMTGGVAKNRGIVGKMEKHLNLKMKRFRIDPQLIGAIGAAVIADEKIKRRMS